MYESDASFDKDLPRIIKYIKNEKCFFAYFDNSSMFKETLPQIYVASGLFTTDQTYGAKDTNSSSYRQNAVLEALHVAGLTNVVTRPSFLESRKSFTRSGSKKSSTRLGPKNSSSIYMYAEQHAYLDLLVLQKASCFIPAAPKGSSLSYAVQRYRSFEIGDFGLVNPSPNHMDFSSWGF
jgi:hypothetical protein